MRCIRRKPYFLLLGLLLATPSLAGVYYKALTETHAEGGKGQALRQAVEGWVDGEQARITFTDSTNPMMGTGTYLLTRDAGKTLYLINPKERTYSKLDLNQIMQGMGALSQSMGPMFKMEISNPKVESLLDEAGEAVAGLSTRHYRFRTTYSMMVKVMGMKNASDVDQLEDLWATDELSDAGLKVWLRSAPAKTGNESFDRLMEAEMSKVRGFPMRMVTVQTTRGGKGKEQVSRTTMEVQALEQKAVPGGTFDMPEGYKEVPLMPGMDEEGNPMRKLFGKDKG